MKKYIDRDNTPLKFHNFLKNVSFPLGLVYYSIMFIYNLVVYGTESFNLLFIIDYAVMVAAIVLIVIALRGLSSWKHSAWKCTVGLFIMTLTYNILYLAILAVFNLSGDGETIMEALQSIIISPFILVYYYKRKSLFSEEKGDYLNKKPSIGNRESNLDRKVDGVVVFHEITKTPDRDLSNFKNMKEEKTKEKSKIRFCKFCGSQIDVQTKKCSGCGKQYFKGIKFNKFLVTVLILSAALLTSIILNVVQLFAMDTLYQEKEYYKKSILKQQVQISELQKEIKEKDKRIRGLTTP